MCVGDGSSMGTDTASANEGSDDDEDDLPLSHLLPPNSSFMDYVTVDDTVDTCENRTDEDIVASVVEERSGADDADADDDEVDVEHTPPKFGDAIKAIEILQQYLVTVDSSENTQQKLAEVNTFINLVHKRFLKQKTVTEFFKYM